MFVVYIQKLFALYSETMFLVFCKICGGGVGGWGGNKHRWVVYRRCDFLLGL